MNSFDCLTEAAELNQVPKTVVKKDINASVKSSRNSTWSIDHLYGASVADRCGIRDGDAPWDIIIYTPPGFRTLYISDTSCVIATVLSSLQIIASKSAKMLVSTSLAQQRRFCYKTQTFVNNNVKTAVWNEFHMSCIHNGD